MYPGSVCVRAICVRADNEIITKSINRVSAKTDRGNHVPKGSRLSRCKRADVLTLLSGASAVTLMVATPCCAFLHSGRRTPKDRRAVRKRATVGQTGRRIGRRPTGWTTAYMHPVGHDDPIHENPAKAPCLRSAKQSGRASAPSFTTSAPNWPNLWASATFLSHEKKFRESGRQVACAA